ncbi:reticulocyte-binding protein 2 homolog a, partial [Plakobranchus ocellatus]
MSELDLYTKYLDSGVKLGRSGEDLTTWVENKVRQDVERSERQIERERKREEMEMQNQREEMEMQKKREEMEMQREEREMQKQREELAFRREEKEKERQLELRRMELEAETKKLEIGSRAGVEVSGPRQSYGAQRPKIPPLHDPSQCGGRGHIRRECPSRPKEANFSSSMPDSSSHSCECPSKPKEANVAFSVPELPYHCCAAKMDSSPSGGLKIESCKVFDRVSTLLRDSGCNTVGVSKALVPPDCYTDNKHVLSSKGPYTVVESRSNVIYLVDLGDQRCTFH